MTTAMHACFAISHVTYLNETWRRQSKVFLWTIMWKWKLMLKISYGTSLEIWSIKRMVQWKTLTAFFESAKCFENSEIKAHKDIVSTTNLAQNFECLTKMRATSSTLFVRVNTGVTENAGMETRLLDYSYHWLFVPRTIRTTCRPFVPWTIRTIDYSYHGLFVP